jgi:hypothetical protein
VTAARLPAKLYRSAVVAGLALVLGGCTNVLETGYKPRKLGSTAIERRAYFAGPFTPAAREAQSQEARERQFERRRPGDRF